MSHILFCTSRKPSQLTRRTVHMLSHLLGAKSENRGKKSVEEVGDRAFRQGCDLVLFVYERHGNPAKLSPWSGEWAPVELRIERVRGNEHKRHGKLPHAAVVEALDEVGEKWKAILDLPDPEGGRFVTVRASRDGLTFSFEGEDILALEGRTANSGAGTEIVDLQTRASTVSTQNPEPEVEDEDGLEASPPAKPAARKPAKKASKNKAAKSRKTSSA